MHQHSVRGRLQFTRAVAQIPNGQRQFEYLFLKQCTFLVGRMLRCICMAWEAVTNTPVLWWITGRRPRMYRLDCSMLLFPSVLHGLGALTPHKILAAKIERSTASHAAGFGRVAPGGRRRLARSTTQHSGSWVYNSWSKISWHTGLPTLRILGRTHCEK